MNNINELIEKYFQAETDLNEEQLLKKYFSLGKNNDPGLENYESLFIALTEEGKIQSQSDLINITDSEELDLEVLIGKYFDASTTREEERLLGSQISLDRKNSDSDILFNAFAEERNIKSRLDKEAFLSLIESERVKKPSGRVIQLNKLLRYAAILIIPIALVLGLRLVDFNTPSTEIAYLKMDVENIENPEEAFAVAMEALKFAGNKMNRGKVQLQENMPHFEKTRIFK